MTIFSHTYKIVRTVKAGWAEWSWLFYIGAIGALLGSYFNIAGIAATGLACTFFYGMGRLHEHAEKKIMVQNDILPTLKGRVS